MDCDIDGLRILLNVAEKIPLRGDGAGPVEEMDFRDSVGFYG